MSRIARASAAFAALLGVVLGLLVCGGTVAAPSPAAVVVDAGAPPGCGQGHPSEGAASPAVPPRPYGNGGGELPPAPVRGAGEDVRHLLTGPDPEPEPPGLVPPSPMELSILRV
ncbi:MULTISPECIES: hypothetical protein [Streptomyces]|uniref:hypothetical protein n=1 Tax=Streptomyces TaxID=1883 RepID=UPI001316AFE5|nr:MULTISPECIES: hypothetical protein [Streptomyces]QGZ50065.1 hypothetical protein GPZ77_18340 [Streptomyces sp. QHH-9511]GGT67003.1 hypothetical protein GCM10010272_06970 [Streptomyces lateritius]